MALPVSHAPVTSRYLPAFPRKIKDLAPLRFTRIRLRAKVRELPAGATRSVWLRRTASRKRAAELRASSATHANEATGADA